MPIYIKTKTFSTHFFRNVRSLSEFLLKDSFRIHLLEFQMHMEFSNSAVYSFLFFFLFWYHYVYSFLTEKEHLKKTHGLLTARIVFTD